MTNASRGPRFFYSEPEAMFRVGSLEGSDDAAGGTMLTGSWMRSADERPNRGSIMVLVDDVFGIAALGHRPEGRWGVSTEISVDFTSDPPIDGRELTAEARLLVDDPEGGLGEGTVRDADGNTIAIGTVRVRYSDVLPPQLADPSLLIPAHDEREDPGAALPVEQLLGAEMQFAEDGATATMVLPPSHQLANAMGPMHGGILSCASELIASQLARRTDEAFMTASVRIVYVRPTPATEPITFTAETRHTGRTLRVIEVTSRTAAGKVGTIALVTCATVL